MSGWSPALVPALGPLVVMLAVLSGCNPMAAWTNNQSGKTLYQAGRYAAAAGAFRRAAIDAPRDPDYLHNYATSLRRMGRYAAAERAYRQALRIDPDHQPSYHGLAVTMKKTGRIAEAYTLLAGWAARKPELAAPMIETAWLQREMGDFAGAAASLRQALRSRPGHPLALANLGQVYEETGRPRLARSAYQRSLATDWNQPRLASRIDHLNDVLEPAPQPVLSRVTPSQYRQSAVISSPLTATNVTPAMRRPVSGRPVVGAVVAPRPSVSGQLSRPATRTGALPDSSFATPPGGRLSADAFELNAGMPLARNPFTRTQGSPLAQQPFVPNARRGAAEAAGGTILKASGTIAPSPPPAPRSRRRWVWKPN